MTTQMALHPRLVVADPDRALDFYQQALSAKLLERYTDDQNRVVHAAISVLGSYVSLTQSVPDWGLLDPLSLDGSPCLLHLTVDEPDCIAERMRKHGAEVVISIADRPYGKREGRIADPSGHLWILSKVIEELTTDEISRKLKL